MPIIQTPKSTAAAGGDASGNSPTAPLFSSLLAAIDKLHWDAVLALVMASDSYYHYETPAHYSATSSFQAPPPSPPHQTTATTDAENSPAAAAAATLHGHPSTEDAKDTGVPPRQLHWFRKFIVSSSSTRLLTYAGALGYLGYVLTHPSHVVPCRVTVSDASSSVPDMDCFLYQSAEGMQLLLRDRLPSWVVTLHAVAGTVLLPLAITQKESVFYMQFARRHVEVTPASASAASSVVIVEDHKGEQQAQSADKKTQLRRARVSRRHHGNLGFTTAACVAAMVAGGVSLRSYSVFSPTAVSARAGVLNFASAMLLFSAPWALLAPATAASGAKAKAAVHAVMGGLLVKAVLAVPFERVLCGLWQRAAGVHVSLPPRPRWFSKLTTSSANDVPVAPAAMNITQHVEGELERVYYKSILATTIIFGVWGVVDIVRFVRLARACVETSASAKKRV